jgi:hypothetical protein
MFRRALVISAISVFVALGAFPAAAQAPDAARLAAAKEMMQAAGAARQFDQVMPTLAAQLSRSFIAVAPDKAAQIREVFSQLMVRFTDRKNELMDQIAQLYAEKLTAEEMTAVTAFYRSPAGAKFVAIQPELMQQAMLIGQRWGENLGREIEEEARRELKKRGIEL